MIRSHKSKGIVPWRSRKDRAPTKETLDRLQEVILQVMRGESWPVPISDCSRRKSYYRSRKANPDRGRWCKVVIGT